MAGASEVVLNAEGLGEGAKKLRGVGRFFFFFFFCEEVESLVKRVDFIVVFWWFYRCS